MKIIMNIQTGPPDEESRTLRHLEVGFFEIQKNERCFFFRNREPRRWRATTQEVPLSRWEKEERRVSWYNA
jgi:hypothetical protein